MVIIRDLQFNEPIRVVLNDIVQEYINGNLQYETFIEYHGKNLNIGIRYDSFGVTLYIREEFVRALSVNDKDFAMEYPINIKSFGKLDSTSYPPSEAFKDFGKHLIDSFLSHPISATRRHKIRVNEDWYNEITEAVAFEKKYESAEVLDIDSIIDEAPDLLESDRYKLDEELTEVVEPVENDILVHQHASQSKTQDENDGFENILVEGITEEISCDRYEAVAGECQSGDTLTDEEIEKFEQREAFISERITSFKTHLKHELLGIEQYIKEIYVQLLRDFKKDEVFKVVPFLPISKKDASFTHSVCKYSPITVSIELIRHFNPAKKEIPEYRMDFGVHFSGTDFIQRRSSYISPYEDLDKVALNVSKDGDSMCADLSVKLKEEIIDYMTTFVFGDGR